MSRNDPLSLECCACHTVTSFDNQGDAIGKWSMQEDSKGVVFALCPKCNMSQYGRDIQTALIMGKTPPEPPLPNISENQPAPALASAGLVVKATFKLMNVEVSSGGKILSGEATPVDAILIGKDLARSLEIGKTYFVNLT